MTKEDLLAHALELAMAAPCLCEPLPMPHPALCALHAGSLHHAQLSTHMNFWPPRPTALQLSWRQVKYAPQQNLPSPCRQAENSFGAHDSLMEDRVSQVFLSSANS